MASSPVNAPIEGEGSWKNAREESNPSLAALEQSPLLSIATGIDADLPTLPGLAANLANMFCSPIQPADPFDFFTSPPHHAYRRRQAYNDPITTALLNEQARREAAYERERQQQQERRAAYEEQLKREAAILKARRLAAARQEYERQLRDLFLQGYRPARQDWQQADEEKEQNEEEETSKPSTSTSQAYIPIRSSTDAKQSEVDMQDMGSESESESEAEEEEPETETETETDQVEDDHVTYQSSAPQRIQTEQTEGSKPKLTYDEAVAIVHKHASAAITIRQRLRALNKIRSVFTEKQSQFRPPATLDFDITKSKAANQPVLSYTANNRPLQAYEENLLRLLTDLDDVPSGGLLKVKKARKALASDIQAELSRIDSYKMQLWERR